MNKEFVSTSRDSLSLKVAQNKNQCILNLLLCSTWDSWDSTIEKINKTFKNMLDN